MSVFAAATKRYRVTVNDVLLTALAGGIRRYLTADGVNTRGMTMETGIPVSLHDNGKPFTRMANEVGVVLVALPVGEVNELTALRIVHRKMVGPHAHHTPPHVRASCV
eukprot:CAMPEP_0175893706 /NCGR_PEP_ID=MMETSP0107_2-20121207/49606_1 /TAXON_ID=195067 ORGANISM="Goniomonas pacifica, Strain CCMP1869" /NCGR_SAMPLE_ID=MMETSP0107_2 /ASSEMBLY_ACC=CAM_ASM_000203 /LENGTH=107 /DNA_ID=CAMNT_0017214759 /DNA_START=805 /DNA_END=1128 /DNA_ORIENTATION=+